MEVGKICVSRADAYRVYCHTLTTGMVGVKIAVSYDDAWAGLVKTAVFRAGKVVRDVVDVDAMVEIPHEVLAKRCPSLQMGIYGAKPDGTIVIPTIWCALGSVEAGADPSGDPSTDPTLPVWQEILKQVAELGEPPADGITPHIGGNGNWWLGETDTGVTAAPVAGVDYFTAADRDDIVRKVIAEEPGIDAAGREMTELWSEVSQLREIVRSWPALKKRNAWAGGNVGTITQIHFVPTYTATGGEDATWNADLEDAGKITGYRSGTAVTISANGNGKIRLNPDSISLFANMASLKSISGLDLIDASQAEKLTAAFYGCFALEEIDISCWHLQRLQMANGMFNNCGALRRVKFSRYGVPVLASTVSMFDGCIHLTSVDMGRGLPAVGDKMFFKCLELEHASGLDSVATVGYRAFVYTPKLTQSDLKAKNIIAIGEAACRLSGIEDGADLSAVPPESVGTMATRSKRWSGDALEAIRRVQIPTVYINVPHNENQDNYPDIQFGTYNGEAVSVAEAGCSSLALYHEWQAIHAGTELEYASYRDWWQATIGATDFVANNTMDNSTVAKMLAILGWTSQGLQFVEGSEQLEAVVARLNAGLPTFASMYSANVDGTHAVLIVGGDAETGKLAILDSHVAGTTGVVSWVAFEDIFAVGGVDYIEPYQYG